MKQQTCSFFVENEALLDRLLNKLAERYPYVSILGQDCLGMRMSVSRSGISVSEDTMFTARGFVVRVHNQRGFVEYSFNEISEDELPQIISAIEELCLKAKGEDPLPTDEKLEAEYFSPYRIDPEEMGSGKIIQRLKALREACMAKYPEILDLSISFSWQKGRKLFLSKNRRLYQDILWTNGAAVAMASDGNDMKDYYKPFSGLCGAELLDEISPEALNKACEICIELLKSEPIEPGED